MGQEASVLKPQESISPTPSPSPSSSSISSASAVTAVTPEPDSTASVVLVPVPVLDSVSSTEDAAATVGTLKEKFQNLGLEDNNKHNGNENDDLKEYNPQEGPGKFQYPQRPDAIDCAYYLRTGICRYGANCRYNHPARRKNQIRRSASSESAEVIKEKEKADLSEKMGLQEYYKGQRSVSPESAQVTIEKEKTDLSEMTEQQECKYYLRSGGCKFGKACRYNHSRGKTMLPPPPPPVDFNFLGLPIRPGERECPYYMRTGSCKYGPNCRFHHPDPTAVGGGDNNTPGSASSHPSGASQPASTPWSSHSNGTVPFIDAVTPYGSMMLPPQRVHPNPEWNGYQVPTRPPERSFLSPPYLALNNPTDSTEVFMHNQQHMLDEFPERPGQPECSHFMKTGDCKYRSACKFNHPKNGVPKGSVLRRPVS
ncbi:zinc finger CCCH domain-containing protein 67-like isoform X2 [Macadamia integrifolia]|uniref:zinc finger CCCH domain-containing protein 67-like isoform X2 n=1 Tax=Macadamia integrifolia TaxID=60698 RepID=UPI001C4E74A7|nr:zinc finger CCCH domain-containing protein 67-like isoform X2 [Macadamia integrifolia]